jgi:hypothetical protein
MVRQKRVASEPSSSTGPRKRQKIDYQGLLTQVASMDGADKLPFTYQLHKKLEDSVANVTDISLDNLTSLKPANYTDVDSDSFSAKNDIFKIIEMNLENQDSQTKVMFVPKNFMDNVKFRSYDTAIAHLCKAVGIEIKGLNAIDNDLAQIKWDSSTSYFSGLLTAISQLIADDYDSFPHPYFPRSKKSKITDSLAGYIYIMNIVQKNVHFGKNLVANVSDDGCDQIGINLVDYWVACGVSNPLARFKPNRFTSLQYKDMNSILEEINERVFSSLKSDKYAKDKRYAIKILLKTYLSASKGTKPENTQLFIHLFRHPNAKKALTYSKIADLATPATYEDTEVTQRKKGGKKSKKKTVRLRKTKTFYKVSKQNFYPEIIRSQIHKECEKDVLKCMEDLFHQFDTDYFYFQGGYFTKIFKNTWKIHNFYSSCLKEIATKQKIIVLRILVHLEVIPRKKGIFNHNQYTIPSSVWSKASDIDFNNIENLNKKNFAILLNPYFQYAYAYYKVYGSYQKALENADSDSCLFKEMLKRYEQNINICKKHRSLVLGVPVSIETLQSNENFKNNLKESIVHNVYNEMNLLINEKDDSPLVGEFACLSLR